jgi:hypothetical protein
MKIPASRAGREERRSRLRRLGLAATLALASFAGAAAGPRSSSAADAKIAVVDVQRAMLPPRTASAPRRR